MVLPALSRLLNMHRTRVLMLQAQRFYFEGKFKPESEERILQVLNASKELEDILRYSISKKNGSKILADKTEKGGYQTLDDPVAIVPPPILEKLYKSIVNEGKKSKGYRGSPINPPLQEEIIAAATRVVSISCVAGRIMWSCMERGNPSIELSGLAVHSLPGKPRAHFLQILETVKQISKDIPEADIYVVDEHTAGVPTSSQVNYLLQRTQMRSFLLGLLASRSPESHFVAVKTLAVARLFQLLVGTERVSGQRVVDELMQSQENIRVKEGIRWKYSNAEPQEREYLSNAFLLNLAFWQLTNQTPIMSSEKTET